MLYPTCCTPRVVPHVLYPTTWCSPHIQWWRSGASNHWQIWASPAWQSVHPAARRPSHNLSCTSATPGQYTHIYTTYVYTEDSLYPAYSQCLMCVLTFVPTFSSSWYLVRRWTGFSRYESRGNLCSSFFWHSWNMGKHKAAHLRTNSMFNRPFTCVRQYRLLAVSFIYLFLLSNDEVKPHCKTIHLKVQLI